MADKLVFFEPYPVQLNHLRKILSNDFIFQHSFGIAMVGRKPLFLHLKKLKLSASKTQE
jgi:hypothetical protein